MKSMIAKLAVLICALSFLISINCKINNQDNAEELPGFKGSEFSYTSFNSASRGMVDISVYLPPGWTETGSETYPLLIFLHGAGQSHLGFPETVSSGDLNDWINQNEIPPLVIVAPKGWDLIEDGQWYTAINVTMLTGEDPSELRAFCRERFRAGMDWRTTSIQGFSRGALGTIHLALNFPGKFASAIANSLVRGSTQQLTDAASLNRDTIINNGLYLRLVIGDADEFLDGKMPGIAQVMHERLEGLAIPHEFEMLPGVNHDFFNLWHHIRPEGIENGLYELKKHAAAWK